MMKKRYLGIVCLITACALLCCGCGDKGTAILIGETKESADVPAEGEQEEERFFYIAVNMHWQVDYLGLPKLPKGKLWTYAASTGKEIPEIEENASSQEICVPARTIVLCATKDVPVETEKAGRKKGKKIKGDDGNS